VLVLLRDADDCIVPREATWWDRLVARLSATRLDHALAAGASPDSSTSLALRARLLVRPKTRLSLARCVQRVLAEGLRPIPRPGMGPVTLRPDTIRNASDELDALIERLLQPAPVSAHGVAQAYVLLTDGGGPLYFPSARQDLREVTHRAVLSLEPLDHF